LKSGIVILENVLDSLGKVTEEYLEKESGRVNSLNLIRKVDNIESRIEIFRAKLTGVEEEPPFNTSSWKNNGLILTEDNSSVLSYLNDNEITERDQLYRWIDKIYKDRQEISLFFPDKENILIGYYLDGDKPKYYFLNRSRVLEYFRKIENEENPEETAFCETKEEIDCNIKIIAYLGYKDFYLEEKNFRSRDLVKLLKTVL